MDKSLELRIERINCLGDLRMKLLQCFYNGETVVENYLNGHSVIHVHGLLNGRKFCYMCRPSKTDRRINDGEFPMFVWIRDFSEDFYPQASIARLQTFNGFNMLITDTSEENPFTPVIQTPYPFIKVFHTIFDRELCSIYKLFGVKTCQLIDKIIQCSSHVVNNLSNQNTDDMFCKFGIPYGGTDNGFPVFSDFEQIRKIRLNLGKDYIHFSLTDNDDSVLQVFEVFACPIDPLISAIQRLHSKTIQRNEHIV